MYSRTFVKSLNFCNFSVQKLVANSSLLSSCQNGSTSERNSFISSYCLISDLRGWSTSAVLLFLYCESISGTPLVFLKRTTYRLFSLYANSNSKKSIRLLSHLISPRRIAAIMLLTCLSSKSGTLTFLPASYPIHTITIF